MKVQNTSQSSSLAEINIIPLVDIMLVLLIIFMVAAPMLQQGIDVNLPEVSAASVDVSEEDFILTVNSDGQVFLNDNKKEKFSLLSIQDKLSAAFKDRKDKTLYLRADSSIQYGYVVEIMSACRQAGVEKIGMITQNPEDDKTTKGRKRRRR